MMQMEQRIEQLENEILELREALRFLVLTVEYQQNPRLTFTKFCSQNFIAGEKYTNLYNYLISLSDEELEDIDTVHSMMSKELGVPHGKEAEGLSAFLTQCPRN